MFSVALGCASDLAERGSSDKEERENVGEQEVEILMPARSALEGDGRRETERERVTERESLRSKCVFKILTFLQSTIFISHLEHFLLRSCGKI